MTFYLDGKYVNCNSTKKCVVALSVMASVIFDSSVRQLWPPLAYIFSEGNSNEENANVKPPKKDWWIEVSSSDYVSEGEEVRYTITKII